MSAPFRCAWWGRNPHVQTIFPNRLIPRPAVSFRRERVDLPDGDFIDIDWTRNPNGPIVLLLHGLQGSSQSYYALALARSFHRAGWRGAVVHFRGCSGEPNRLARSYYAGDTGDIAYVARMLRRRHPEAPLAAVGVSLGGNVLVKWLGETATANPLAAAVAVSVPFLLDRAADRLETGFARVYQRDLLQSLRDAIKAKRRRMTLPVPVERLSSMKTLRAFDDRITAPLHGFRDSAHYYAECSSRRFLRDIRVPTLLIQAHDDPFMTPDVIPQPHELSPSTRLEAYAHGGHVGFIGGKWPWRPQYWLASRIPDFLRDFLHVPARDRGVQTEQRPQLQDTP